MQFSDITNYTSIVGIPIYAMVILGIVPTIATLVSFARHVVGFRSFSIFVPIITTIVFLELGIFYGVVISTIVFSSTIIARQILIKYRLHYFVRISFIYTAVCFVLFSVLATSSLFLDVSSLEYKPLFPIILLVTLVEEYFKTVIREGESKVVIMFLETLAISIVGYLIISSTFFTKVVLDNIWILLLLFPINFMLAGWEGLRFSEFARFKNVIGSEMRRMEEEDESKKSKRKRKKKKEKDKQDAKQAKPSTKTYFW